MKVSIITVCYNSEKTIGETIESVNEQNHDFIEHIFIDGGSVDNTLEIIKSKSKRIAALVSEKDNGIYDAMNKGIKLASGEILAFLNSDDKYRDDEVISSVASIFKENLAINCVYGDVIFVNEVGDETRKWIAGAIPENWSRGYQIPHPALFLKKTILETNQIKFDPSYRIAADLKMQLQLLNVGLIFKNSHYLQKTIAQIRIGGVSTSGIKSVVKGAIESARAYNEVYGQGGLFFSILKIVHKKKVQGKAKC